MTTHPLLDASLQRFHGRDL